MNELGLKERAALALERSIRATATDELQRRLASLPGVRNLALNVEDGHELVEAVDSLAETYRVELARRLGITRRADENE